MQIYKAFEEWIAQLVQDLGHNNVRKNTIYVKEFNGVKTRYEIDVVYGIFWKKYVECKYLEKGNVKLGEIAKFKSVLDLLEIPNRKGIVVTNRNFTTRAACYAKQNRIALYNKEDLEKLDRERSFFYSKRSLEEKINDLIR